MSDTRNAKTYAKEAMQASLELDRETYKNIKHMDKVTLSNYLVAVYQRGYKAGVKSMNNVISACNVPTSREPLPIDVPDNSDGEIE